MWQVQRMTIALNYPEKKTVDINLETESHIIF